MEAKFNTPEGRLLCVNRSIQAEGSFALTKQDLDYRRFMCRGRQKVSAEWSLLSIAANILKLHHKLKNGRLGAGLLIPKNFAVAL